MAEGHKSYAWEDFYHGQVITFGGKTVSSDEIIAFAREFDPQPFHLDDEAARKTLLGGLAASGWHSCAMLMRMICDAYLLDSTCLGAPGVEEVRWLKPVRPGAELNVRCTCLETRASASRPEMGLCKFTWDMFNQAGEHLMTMTATQMFARRQAGDVS